MEKTIELIDPAEWVDQHGDMMLGMAVARIGQVDVAEDLVQETFLAAWKGRDSFDGRSSVRTWLCSILRRKIADYFRRSRREAVMAERKKRRGDTTYFDGGGRWINDLGRWQATPDSVAENAEFWEIIGNCLREMPVHFAQVFHLREQEQATTGEICEQVGITPKNLSVRLHRARLMLRRCLETRWFGTSGQGGRNPSGDAAR